MKPKQSDSPNPTIHGDSDDRAALPLLRHRKFQPCSLACKPHLHTPVSSASYSPVPARCHAKGQQKRLLEEVTGGVGFRQSPAGHPWQHRIRNLATRRAAGSGWRTNNSTSGTTSAAAIRRPVNQPAPVQTHRFSALGMRDCPPI